MAATNISQVSPPVAAATAAVYGSDSRSTSRKAQMPH